MRDLHDRLKRFYDKRGVLGVLELIFSPFLTPIFLVPAWLKSLWNSRVLLYGQWSKYHGFHPRNAINCFFYKTQWLNLDRYGRCGISPVIGLGNYPLSKWFHLTMFSSCLYANAGAVVTLGGTLIWVLSHLVWLSVASWQWVAVVTLLLFFSSTTYAMAFVRQNYNILGWMWLPIGFYAVATNQYALAAFMWLLASFASFTAVVTVTIMLFFMTIFERDLFIGLTIVPALLKLFFHFLPLLRTGGVVSSIFNTAKLIGLVSKKQTKYKRSSAILSHLNVYFIFLYGLACIFLWIGTGNFPRYPVIAFIMFILNQIKFRFADEQSIVMFLSGIGAFTLMQYPRGGALIFSILFLLNPAPFSLGVGCLKRGRGFFPIDALKPFDHSFLLFAMRKFLSPVEKGSRVLFAFNDPMDLYDSLFDGYRVILELPLFVASERGFSLFPDWYCIAETNYKNAPDCWGRTIEDVLRNTNQWGVKYTIIYTLDSAQLEDGWSKYFDIVGEFDWSDWTDLFGDSLPWGQTESVPKWWLLKLKTFN